MQLEVGGIYEGKVTGITKFGAFISFEGGQTGMVHISEVSSTYVNEIKDYVTEGQVVKVMVLSIGDGGKISLSMKKALSPEEQKSQSERRPPAKNRRPFTNQRRPYTPPPPGPARPGDFEWQGRSNDSGSFEDMMSKFKQTSDEKISDLKRGNDTRRGYSRRGSGGKS